MKAYLTLQSYEVVNMIYKGQINGVEKGDVMVWVSFINEIFGAVA